EGSPGLVPTRPGLSHLGSARSVTGLVRGECGRSYPRCRINHQVILTAPSCRPWWMAPDRLLEGDSRGRRGRARRVPTLGSIEAPPRPAGLRGPALRRSPLKDAL